MSRLAEGDAWFGVSIALHCILVRALDAWREGKGDTLAWFDTQLLR